MVEDWLHVALRQHTEERSSFHPSGLVSRSGQVSALALCNSALIQPMVLAYRSYVCSIKVHIENSGVYAYFCRLYGIVPLRACHLINFILTRTVKRPDGSNRLCAFGFSMSSPPFEELQSSTRGELFLVGDSKCLQLRRLCIQYLQLGSFRDASTIFNGNVKTTALAVACPLDAEDISK